MRVFRTIKSIEGYIASSKAQNRSVGLVPTMGALHTGHIRLLEQAIKQNDISVCSVYINPEQFNSKSDLAKYPRQEGKDLAILKKSGCDVVFIPKDEELYSQPPELKLNFGKIESILEGEFRPGHFAGVGLIVSKLFNIIKPDRAYFGLKDLQQCLVIDKLVRDLSYPIKLVFLSTIREENGLAISSRNERLSKHDKEMASNLYMALCIAKERISRRKSIASSKAIAKLFLSEFEKIRIEYLEVLDITTCSIATRINRNHNYSICIAAYVGTVRLIDNVIIP